MSKNKTIRTMLITLIAAFTLAGASFATSRQEPQQHQEHHAEAASQEASSGMPAMCEQMMAEMGEHMASMSEMMANMHGDAAMHSEGAREGMHAEGGEQMMGDMMGMMDGMMASPAPASIDDPAVAEQHAERLEGMLVRMRTHIEKLEAQAEALRQRAAEIR